MRTVSVGYIEETNPIAAIHQFIRKEFKAGYSKEYLTNSVIHEGILKHSRLKLSKDGELINVITTFTPRFVSPNSIEIKLAFKVFKLS